MHALSATRVSTLTTYIKLHLLFTLYAAASLASWAARAVAQTVIQTQNGFFPLMLCSATASNLHKQVKI